MPIYEYRCTDCGHDFSKLQKVSADLPACPECGHDEVAKKVSKTTFQLKGGGWYVTDFRDGGGGPGAAKKPEEATADAASTETKPDASVDTKADTKVDAKVPAKSSEKPAAPTKAASPKKAKKSPGPSGSGSA